MKDYLNKNVLCKISASQLGGVGVFAIQDIKQGTELCHYGNDFITLEVNELDALVPEVRDLIVSRTIFEKGQPITFVNPNRTQLMQAFMNHSDNPNSDGKLALKDIKKGEEVTENYLKLPITEMSEISKKYFHAIIG